MEWLGRMEKGAAVEGGWMGAGGEVTADRRGGGVEWRSPSAAEREAD